MGALRCNLDVIDAYTLEGITTIDGFTAPVDVFVHPDGTQLYVTYAGNDTVSVIDTVPHALITAIDVGSKPSAYGESVGPGVPRLLKTDAVARLEVVKATIEADSEGVVSPLLAIEHLESALDSGNLCLQEGLWSISEAGDIDSRRLHTLQGWPVLANVRLTLDPPGGGAVLSDLTWAVPV